MVSADARVARAPAKIECSNLWKIYGPEGAIRKAKQKGLHALGPEGLVASGLIPAVCGVDFSVSAGEIFVIMGLSGSGKSTVIRCLARLIEPSDGKIAFDGDDFRTRSAAELIEIRRHRIGMVFQNFGLMPHLTVLQNVVFPLEIQGRRSAEAEERALACIALVGLEGRERNYPQELSGGQQQRVGIARSLVVDPELWFLDEPFSALDPLIRKQLQDEFLGLQRRLKKTIVFVTHDFLEAVRIADRIAIMKDGRIEQLGRPSELVLTPATPYVEEFVRDVPRSRVLTAADVIEPGAARPRGDAACDGSSTIETVMAMFAGGAESISVEMGGVGYIGTVTQRSVFRALSKPWEKQ